MFGAKAFQADLRDEEPLSARKRGGEGALEQARPGRAGQRVLPSRGAQDPSHGLIGAARLGPPGTPLGDGARTPDFPAAAPRGDPYSTPAPAAARSPGSSDEGELLFDMTGVKPSWRSRTGVAAALPSDTPDPPASAEGPGGAGGPSPFALSAGAQGPPATLMRPWAAGEDLATPARPRRRDGGAAESDGFPPPPERSAPLGAAAEGAAGPSPGSASSPTRSARVQATAWPSAHLHPAARPTSAMGDDEGSLGPLGSGIFPSGPATPLDRRAGPPSPGAGVGGQVPTGAWTGGSASPPIVGKAGGGRAPALFHAWGAPPAPTPPRSGTPAGAGSRAASPGCAPTALPPAALAAVRAAEERALAAEDRAALLEARLAAKSAEVRVVGLKGGAGFVAREGASEPEGPPPSASPGSGGGVDGVPPSAVTASADSSGGSGVVASPGSRALGTSDAARPEAGVASAGEAAAALAVAAAATAPETLRVQLEAALAALATMKKSGDRYLAAAKRYRRERNRAASESALARKQLEQSQEMCQKLYSDRRKARACLGELERRNGALEVEAAEKRAALSSALRALRASRIAAQGLEAELLFSRGESRAERAGAGWDEEAGWDPSGGSPPSGEISGASGPAAGPFETRRLGRALADSSSSDGSALSPRNAGESPLTSDGEETRGYGAGARRSSAFGDADAGSRASFAFGVRESASPGGLPDSSSAYPAYTGIPSPYAGAPSPYAAVNAGGGSPGGSGGRRAGGDVAPSSASDATSIRDPTELPFQTPSPDPFQRAASALWSRRGSTASPEEAAERAAAADDLEGLLEELQAQLAEEGAFSPEEHWGNSGTHEGTEGLRRFGEGEGAPLGRATVEAAHAQPSPAGPAVPRTATDPPSEERAATAAPAAAPAPTAAPAPAAAPAAARSASPPVTRRAASPGPARPGAHEPAAVRPAARSRSPTPSPPPARTRAATPATAPFGGSAGERSASGPFGGLGGERSASAPFGTVERPSSPAFPGAAERSASANVAQRPAPAPVPERAASSAPSLPRQPPPTKPPAPTSSRPEPVSKPDAAGQDPFAVAERTAAEALGRGDHAAAERALTAALDSGAASRQPARRRARLLRARAGARTALRRGLDAYADLLAAEELVGGDEGGAATRSLLLRQRAEAASELGLHGEAAGAWARLAAEAAASGPAAAREARKRAAAAAALAARPGGGSLSATSARAVLGIAPGAPASDARAAFRRLALRYHPDKAAGRLAPGAAAKIFALVSEAHSVAVAGGTVAEKRPASKPRAAAAAAGRAARAWAGSGPFGVW